MSVSDDIRMSVGMFALSVGELQNTLSLTMLGLSSILREGLRHGILTSEDYSALQKDYKIYAKSATSIKATLNRVFEKVLDQNNRNETNEI